MQLSTFTISAFQRGITPEPIITVTEWADRKRMLPSTSAMPGRFRSSITPYLIEIMDRLSVTDQAQLVVVMKGSQVGFTECGNNFLGSVIDNTPGPFLYVMPTETLMEDTSKTRIGPMIESTPSLKKKVMPEKRTKKNNSILYKEFEGGFVKMVGANSPAGLRSVAVRFLYFDEVDGYPLNLGGEGSALKLGETRTSTFGAMKKIFYTSTPTIKGRSAIDKEFEKTGKRYYHVPCPHCGTAQMLVFEQLRYEMDKWDATKYECIHCGEQIPEHYKPKMLNAGKWIAEKPEKEDGIRYGYHLSAMYSPYGFYSWGNMAKDYEESKKDLFEEIVWTNTKKGECFEEKGEKPDWQTLMDRAEDYQPNLVMNEVIVITAGVDVQGNRLELEIVGWMPGMRSQSIDYRVFEGDTSNVDSECWKKLAAVIDEQFTRQDGALIPLWKMAVDSGYNTQTVYDFTKKHGNNRAIPVKGDENLKMYFRAPRATQVRKDGKPTGTVLLYGVGVSHIKSWVYGKLKLPKMDEAGNLTDGYCFFPKRDSHYFKGLTAEQLQMKPNKGGYPEYRWVKLGQERNEPLDCRVYAMAAATVLGIDRWKPERWTRENMNYEPVTAQSAKPVVKKQERRKSQYWDKDK